MTDDDGDLHARIEARAYQIWVDAGMPEGRAEDFWQLAKAQIESEDRDDKISLEAPRSN